MTTQDEHDNDGSLKSYLDGKDGVSATYRKVAGEQPPAALDALILQAAAGAVTKPVPKPGATWRQHYAMAASLCLGVLLTSLYYEQQPVDSGPLIVTASVDQPQVRELDIAAPAATDNSIEEVAVQGFRVRSEPGPADAERPQAAADSAQADVARTESFMAPAAPVPQGVPGDGQSARAPVELVQPQGNGRMPPPTTRASEPDAEVAVQFGAAQGATGQQEQATGTGPAAPVQDAPAVAAEELLSVPPVAATSVQQQAQTLWLEEIIRLARELESLTSEAGALRQRLDAELASFSAAYPDFDLDAALAE